MPSTRRLLPLALAAAGLALTAGPAAAAPSTDPQASAADAAHQLEIVTEQFNTARETSAQAAAAAAGATKADADAQAALTAARTQVRAVARSAYTGSRLTGAQALLTSGSAGDVVTRLSTLQAVADHSATVVRGARGAAKTATTAKATAEKAAAEAKSNADQLAGRQQQLTADIARYQAETRALTARQQAQTAAAITKPVTTGTATTGTATAVATPVAATTRVAAAAAPAAAAPATGGAVQRALSQLGKPYVWAANGPSSFDCSGLVQFAYSSLGLPHSSSMQSKMGARISRAEARPGDLVAFYSPVSHIGIYLGDGKMVHAPTSGDVVKIASVDVMGAAPQFNRIG